MKEPKLDLAYKNIFRSESHLKTIQRLKQILQPLTPVNIIKVAL